jgi:hypothetical protein
VRHDEVREALGRHLEGELGSAERCGVEQHLSVCASCRAEHRELRATVELLRGLPDPEPPAGLVPGILRRLESAPAPPRGGLLARGLRAIARGTPLPVPIAALAAGLVLLALAGSEEGRLALQGAGGAAAPAATPAPEPDGAFALAPTVELRAPTAPSVVIDADELEPVGMDPARVPRASRRRFVMPAGVGAGAAPAGEAGAALPPRPALAACVGEATAQAGDPAAQCRPWLQGMLALAQYDPRGFLAEVEILPDPEAAAWLAELARFSREARTSDAVASRLRSTPDARVVALARWFEPRPGERAR